MNDEGIQLGSVDCELSYEPFDSTPQIELKNAVPAEYNLFQNKVVYSFAENRRKASLTAFPSRWFGCCRTIGMGTR